MGLLMSIIENMLRTGPDGRHKVYASSINPLMVRLHHQGKRSAPELVADPENWEVLPGDYFWRKIEAIAKARSESVAATLLFLVRVEPDFAQDPPHPLVQKRVK